MSTYTRVHEPLWSQELLLRPKKGELSITAVLMARKTEQLRVLMETRQCPKYHLGYHSDSLGRAGLNPGQSQGVKLIFLSQSSVLSSEVTETKSSNFNWTERKINMNCWSGQGLLICSSEAGFGNDTIITFQSQAYIIAQRCVRGNTSMLRNSPKLPCRGSC